MRRCKVVKKVLLLLVVGASIAWWSVAISTSHLWFSTISADSLLGDTTQTVFTWSGFRRLKEITFIYDMNDVDTKLELDTSKVILVFDGDSFVTTWDTVFVYYSGALADEWVPGIFRIWDYDTATSTIRGRLTSEMILRSFDIGIFNGGDSVATFKAGLIWEDVYTR